MIERDSTLNRISVTGPQVSIEPGAYPEKVVGHAPRAWVKFPTAPYTGANWTAEQLFEWAEAFAEAAEAQAKIPVYEP